MAMSGGVDSSVAAALLKDQGYDVVGVFMKLWSEKADPTDLVRENICCSLEASAAARAVARKLDIPFYTVNFAKEFRQLVVQYYIDEYEAGRTPNPCVICNRDIKGELLFNKMKELGGDYLATGHYARIKSTDYRLQQSTAKNNNGNRSLVDGKLFHLLQSKDKNKDQTYFLWTLAQEKLAHLLFPIGDLTKPEVRELARKYNLPTAEKRESQGICFIPDRDICGFLRRYAQNLTQPGPIIDVATKKQIGQHDGLINYTIGQRERLGLGGPKAYYVVKLNVRHNILEVGDSKDLYRKDLTAEGLNWINPVESEKLKAKSQIRARIRHGHPIELCETRAVSGERLSVNFSKPQRAITPGQSIVFYKGEEVLGGGVIQE